MSWKRWSLLNHSLLPLLLALMRYAWLWPWLALARLVLAPSHIGDLAPTWALIGLPLLSCTLAHLVTTGNAPGDDARANQPGMHAAVSNTIPIATRVQISVAGLFVVIGVLWWHFYRVEYTLANPAWLRALGEALIRWDGMELPAPALTLLLLVFLWLRGLRDAVRPLNHDDIWGALLGGIVALVLYLALMTFSDLSIPVNAFRLVLLLFAAGMLALAFSSLKITVGLDRALGLGQRRTSKTPTVNRYWLASVLVTVGGLLLLSLGLALLIAPEQVAQLLALLGAAASVVGRWLGSLLLMIGYLLFVVAYYIALLLEPLIRLLANLLGGQREQEKLGAPEQPEPLSNVPDQVAALPDSYRWLALAAFALVVLIIFALSLRRLLREPETETDEVRESIFSTELLQDQLAALLRRWFGRQPGEEADPYLSLEGEPETRRVIRTVYQQLLTAMAQLGRARPPGQTPQEYMQQLTDQLGRVAAPLALIGDGYQSARYAAEPPPLAVAEQVRQAWEQVKTEITLDTLVPARLSHKTFQEKNEAAPPQPTPKGGSRHGR